MGLILTTLYANLIVAKLVAKKTPKQIRNLHDLREHSHLKILVQENGFAHGFFKETTTAQDLQHRLVLVNYRFKKISHFQPVVEKVLSEEAVLVEDHRNFQALLNNLQGFYSLEQFFFSETIESKN